MLLSARRVTGQSDIPSRVVYGLVILCLYPPSFLVQHSYNIVGLIASFPEGWGNGQKACE